MKKTGLFFTVMLSAHCLIAQLADGIKFLNYDKIKSAKEAFQKAYDANSKDPQTIYWLGQALIASNSGDPSKEQIDAAKSLYQKGLQEIGSDPFLLVGMGHIEMLENGNINSVKQKFEQAVTASIETKGKNKGKPNALVLNAIGRANAEVHSKVGDAPYAIEKLKQAAGIDLVNPDIMINMGINYLRMGGENGGEAVKAYQDAISRDPKSALAFYKIGKIYQSQNNKELYEQNFNAAIAADASFPSPYLALYDAYAEKDVNRAKEYLDKFVATADLDPLNEFFQAEYLFRSQKNAESIAKAQELENKYGLQTLPRLNVLYAYNYDRLKDSVKAKESIQKFLDNAPADHVQASDYDLAMKILAKFPGSEATAIKYIQQAISVDTNTVNKINYMNAAATMSAKAKNYAGQLNWLLQMAALKKNLSNTDYYYLTDAAIRSKSYAEADRLSDEYIAKFPDQLFGYRAKAQAAIAIDADTTKGSAVPAVLLYIDFLKKDPVKNAKTLPYQFYYLTTYYHDKAKDYAKTLEVLNALLGIYPADNFALQVKPIVEKELAGPPAKAVKQGSSASKG